MLYVNGSQPKSVIVGGWDYRAVKVVKNGIETGVWGKPFTLTYSVNTSGATISVKRISSPNQHASTGVTLTNGSTIYYGDELEFTAVLEDGYTAASWEFNGSVVWGENIGTITRTCEYDLNVVLYTEASGTMWRTVWTGSNSYSQTTMIEKTTTVGFGLQSGVPTRVSGTGYNKKTTTFTEVELPAGTKTQVVSDNGTAQYITYSGNSLTFAVKGSGFQARGIVLTKIEQYY